MTEYNAQITPDESRNKTYHIQFNTDNIENFKKVEKLIQGCIDEEKATKSGDPKKGNKKKGNKVNYIHEVMSITRSKCRPDYLLIKLVVCCDGSRKVVVHSVTDEEWEREQKQGYYIA